MKGYFRTLVIKMNKFKHLYLDSVEVLLKLHNFVNTISKIFLFNYRYITLNI